MQTAVQTLEEPEQIAALAHSFRARLLDRMREPATAAGLARHMGRTRQYVSYHIKELERVGLVQRTGERRKGNFVEQLYQTTARRFVVSSHFATDPEQLTRVLRDQVSLARLVDVGERLQKAAALLIDQAAQNGAEIPSASIEAELRFASEADRSAFLSDYVEMLQELLTRHGHASGAPFRVATAIYPEPEQEDSA